MPTWLWGVLIWFALLALFVARWDWSRASNPADATSEPDSRIDESDMNGLLAKATVAATGIE
ncbi:hypothetical protein AWB81_01866 [Caballeronia arationis]|uniref:hypothetical protein n=1 Tax=Caballeronia arationis TaxID=1777142 RepID=UPI00074BAF8C|nr:hypothetical protein [Caballeronia arationis]SAK59589.1 hypothetical protein AWB81_01866 [Caballeronia arationis]